MPRNILMLIKEPKKQSCVWSLCLGLTGRFHSWSLTRLLFCHLIMDLFSSDNKPNIPEDLIIIKIK